MSTKEHSLKLLQLYSDYRYFWIANFLSALAVWLQNTGAGILMSHLTVSPLTIALVQFSATFSVLLVTLPFAFVVDSFSPYRFMFLVQIILFLNALCLAILSYWFLSPTLLLIFTFIIGAVSAVRMPMGQSTISETVSPEHIKSAAILNNWGFNVARVVGPAIAGFLFFYSTSSITFLCVTLIFLLSSFHFYQKSKHEPLLKESLSLSIVFQRAKLIKNDIKNKVFQHTVAHSFMFFILATSTWAFLPYYATYQLQVNGKIQGLFISFIGLGAIIAGLLLPLLRQLVSARVLHIIAGILVSFLLIGFAITTWHLIIYTLFLMFGFSWAMSFALCNGQIQAAFNKTSRARMIALYFFITYSGLAIGNYLTGFALTHINFNTFCFLNAGLLLMKIGYDIFKVLTTESVL